MPKMGCHRSIASTETKLQQSRVEILAEAKDFSLLQNVQTGSVAHPASYLKGTKVLSWGYSSQGIILFIYLQLAG
jgi:hypothetical protein